MDQEFEARNFDIPTLAEFVGYVSTKLEG